MASQPGSTAAIYERYEAGDHWLVLGEVLELSVPREGGALVFHGGAFRPLDLIRVSFFGNFHTRVPMI